MLEIYCSEDIALFGKRQVSVV